MILLAASVAKELSFWNGRPDVEVLLTGVGPVEAACAVAHELERRKYLLAISAGIAGAFDGAASVGDGVVVTTDAFAIEREDGRPLALPAGEAVVERAHSDPHLVAQLHVRGFAKVKGITVATVTTSESTARRLASRGAQVESMEGFAVLRAAQRAGVAGLEIRGISNRVGPREEGGWDFGAGVLGLERILTTLLHVLDTALGEERS